MTSAHQPKEGTRLEGLDIARFLAFAGMLVVNFHVVMVAESQGWAGRIAIALEGRAAALFVVLAGIGIGLFAAKTAYDDLVGVMFRRAVFLFALGMVNTIVFPADILHYYAFYFLLSLPFLKASSPILITMTIVVLLGFLVLVFSLNYDAGWDWGTLEYTGFWTLSGFIRNTLFNGWHPAIPWVAFLFFGMLLARLKLQTRGVQTGLVLIGLVAAITLHFGSAGMVSVTRQIDQELAYLFMVQPIPPGPFYMLSNMASASSIIGLCLMLEPILRRARLAGLLAKPGRLALTLYVAHIYLGLAFVDPTTANRSASSLSALLCAGGFCITSIIFAEIWARKFKRGPLEAAMRRFLRG